ncbi:hypothetical protein BofuT4_uP128850.1 [Botrytis cinerea T4]|uniref:Uncharacterized protein n=1 Tax=Botryotinia fuckeliana (strain T4) TaxID=999810 RepID=G2YRD7_BOTF4|nr:hypothetical protein BofuT4_uP128850.1 [Botrytis cinerea T4]
MSTDDESLIVFQIHYYATGDTRLTILVLIRSSNDVKGCMESRWSWSDSLVIGVGS